MKMKRILPFLTDIVRGQKMLFSSLVRFLHLPPPGNPPIQYRKAPSEFSTLVQFASFLTAVPCYLSSGMTPSKRFSKAPISFPILSFVPTSGHVVVAAQIFSLSCKLSKFERAV